MIRHHLPLLFFCGMALLAIPGCMPPPDQTEAPKPISEPEAKGLFFGQEPKAEAQLLAPDLLGTPLVEYNGTFTPEGDLFYYTMNAPERSFIMTTRHQDDGTWTTPEAASFTSGHTEYDPIFSIDGKRLYFSSQRPTEDSPEGKKSHVWFIEQSSDGWGAPQLVDLTNTGDFYTSLTHGGNLYFNVWNKGTILCATPSDTGYRIDTLPPAINGQGDVGDPFVSPDEDYLIFRGYGEDSRGQGDLFISFRINGEWTPRENLGPQINSERHEMCPWVSADGKRFIFASARLLESYPTDPLPNRDDLTDKHGQADNGRLNLYLISADFIQKMKAKHLGESSADAPEASQPE